MSDAVENNKLVKQRLNAVLTLPGFIGRDDQRLVFDLNVIPDLESLGSELLLGLNLVGDGPVSLKVVGDGPISPSERWFLTQAEEWSKTLHDPEAFRALNLRSF